LRHHRCLQRTPPGTSSAIHSDRRAPAGKERPSGGAQKAHRRVARRTTAEDDTGGCDEHRRSGRETGTVGIWAQCGRARRFRRRVDRDVCWRVEAALINWAGRLHTYRHQTVVPLDSFSFIRYFGPPRRINTALNASFETDATKQSKERDPRGRVCTPRPQDKWRDSLRLTLSASCEKRTGPPRCCRSTESEARGSSWVMEGKRQEDGGRGAQVVLRGTRHTAASVSHAGAVVNNDGHGVRSVNRVEARRSTFSS